MTSLHQKLNQLSLTTMSHHLDQITLTALPKIFSFAFNLWNR